MALLKYFFSKKPIENARQLLKRRRFKFWRQILYIQNGLKVQNSCAACRGRGGEFAVCHLETGKWQIKRLRDIKWKCSDIWRQFGQIQNGTVLITAWHFQWVSC